MFQCRASRINVDTTSQIVVHLLEDGFVGVGDGGALSIAVMSSLSWSPEYSVLIGGLP